MPNAARSCGSCTLCCTVVPVGAPLNKPAYQACQHLAGAFHTNPVGCGVYATRPVACQRWSCMWLTSPGGMPDELRPDRCGVVIDPVIDAVRVDGKDQPAAQVWAAPGYEMAFQDNELLQRAIRALLADVPVVLWRYRGEDGKQLARAIVRLPNGGVGLGPPAAPVTTLGTERERFARADELMMKQNLRLCRECES